MSQIKVTDLTFSYEGVYDNIFEHVNFIIDTNWKLGFIGRNGRGKTTFLNLLLGKYSYRGQIKSSVSFDYFPFEVTEQKVNTLNCMKNIIAPFSDWEQEMEHLINENTPESLERYGVLLEQYTANDGYIIEELIKVEISKLSLTLDVLERAYGSLSNGEQTKVMLAALFLKKNNFLLIDEPTNHLDRMGREILASYLKGKKSFILVSHDRYFLDQCIDHVLSINQCNIEIQKGNFTSWQTNKDLSDQYEINRNEKLLKDISHLTAAAARTAKWSDKVEDSKIGQHSPDRGYLGHMAAKMMKRSKSIEKRQTDAIEEKKGLLKNIEKSDALKMNILNYPKKKYIIAEDLSIFFGDRVLFEGLNFMIEQGDRTVIQGGNGSGKSSLLKLLLGESMNYRGRYLVSNELKISYVPQDTSFLRGTLKDYAANHGLNETLFLSVLYQLDFPRIQFEKEMQHYSAGQKKKVLLAKSLIEPAHLFIWDEPLNYVDVLSRMQLEELLKLYAPTIIFVEHDKTFTEKIATKKINL